MNGFWWYIIGFLSGIAFVLAFGTYFYLKGFNEKGKRTDAVVDALATETAKEIRDEE